ncbi:ABC transporter permease [Halomonas llamarensis]|uniref:ABC transporter permease subunit n=1 Tax=Halomonas llamarensis TaxID=2945104 RepID=A0ABT0SLT6_9GAMM|nr:ABC transporter permease subunit [Halomonas llamarensis]MCL7928702.1 ABC transporter permease subunit [Halomonas llamarensis]
MGSVIRTCLGWGGSLTGVLLFVALWEWGSLAYGSFLLPGPRDALSSLRAFADNGQLWTAVWATTFRAITGFAIAALVGTALGLVAGLFHTIGRALEPVSTVLLGIPPIAWIVLALLWFGSGSMAAVYTVVVTTVPVAFAGAQIGARTLDHRLQEMGDVFQVPFGMRLRDFYLPHIVSYVFPALITALGVAWKVTVMAELFATEEGVGAGMAMARVSLDTAGAMAWIVVVVTLLLVAEHGFLRPLQKKMEPWRQVKSPAMPV